MQPVCTHLDQYPCSYCQEDRISRGSDPPDRERINEELKRNHRREDSGSAGVNGDISTCTVSIEQCGGVLVVQNEINMTCKFVVALCRRGQR